MNELDLHKFLKDNNVEMRWDGDQLSMWLEHYSIKDFADLIGEGIFDYGGIECNMRQGGTIWLDLVQICDHFGIEPERKLPKPE